MVQKPYDTLIVSTIEQHILKVTLNRPDAANAFNTAMAWELVNVFEQLAVDPPLIRAVIVTGAGNRAFCAGADLKEREGMDDTQWHAQHLVFERMMRAIIDCPVPVIGAINGAAYGGGCEIASALDFTYAAKNARFAQTEVRVGIIPGAGGTQLLSRKIGESKANELILTGNVISAQQALEWGLVNAVFEQEVLQEQVITVATRIAKNAPIAVRQAKQAIHRGLQMSLRDGMAFELEAYYRAVNTDDRVEGIAAFNEKRSPDFKGR